MTIKPQKPELLAPAGSLRKLKTAVLYGADAVYIGGTEFGLRKAADNFSLTEMAEGVAYAHEHGAKVFVVLNGFPHQEDMASLPAYLEKLEAVGPDALIISDVGVMSLARKMTSIACHVSTQASVMNASHAAFWKKVGANRVVVGREVSLDECKIIRERAGIEVESFIHGSMCTSNSGKCVISNYTAGRDSNRGGCIQSCRYDFDIIDSESGKELYSAPIMNSKDLMAVRLLPSFIRAGVDSLKVEGRMKSEMYVANTVAVYRQAVDMCWQAMLDGMVLDESLFAHWESRLMDISNRTFTTGSLNERAYGESINYDFTGYTHEVSFVGLFRAMLGNGEAILEVKEAVRHGDALEVLHPSGELQVLTISQMTDMDDQLVEVIQPNRLVRLPVDMEIEPLTIVRRRKVVAQVDLALGGDLK